jgi:hypothetical protein
MRFCEQEFSGSAEERPDTPLLNFAGAHSARPDRSPLAFPVDK